MNHEPRPIRHHVERRVRPERRSGLDRRIAERRLRGLTVVVERRGVIDRRSRIERRSFTPRRKLRDRRGSGLTFNESTPS
ncbi:MAG TPA: hypothetical protein VH439_13195 [Gemmatimonadales bacterium]